MPVSYTLLDVYKRQVLELAAGDPAGFEGLQAVLADEQRGATLGHTAATATELLAIFNALRH